MSITPKQRQDLAAKAGVNEQFLYQCLRGLRNMSPKNAVKIEKLSKGAISRADLRTDWADVWPGFKAKKVA